jgi:hypothetical protein
MTFSNDLIPQSILSPSHEPLGHPVNVFHVHSAFSCQSHLDIKTTTTTNCTNVNQNAVQYKKKSPEHNVI